MLEYQITPSKFPDHGFDVESYGAILILDLDLINVNFPEAFDTE